MSSAIVLLAAGSGTRVGAGTNKVLLPLAGVPVLVRSLRTALAVPGVAALVVVVRPGDEAEVAALLEPELGEREVRLVAGGATRHASEAAALAALADVADDLDVVALHDAARPLATVDLYERAIVAAREHGGGVPAAPVPPLVRRAGGPVPGVGRDVHAVGVQTPQAFRAPELLAAYRWAAAHDFDGTDTAACVDAWAGATGAAGGGLRIVAVESTAPNLKVTYAEDLRVAAALLD